MICRYVQFPLELSQIKKINRYFVEKKEGMDATQVRQRIHEYVDQADERFLTLINGMIDADNDQDWWNSISLEERKDIEEGMAQADRGELRPHSEVMAKHQKWL